MTHSFASPEQEETAWVYGWRKQTARESLHQLENVKAKFGISRITEITTLDKIGLPVFAAIRPNAKAGSLAVSSGKSLDRESARLGALCEAIELSCAEFDPSVHPIEIVSADEFSAQGICLEDFAVGSPNGYVKHSDKVACFRATDYFTGKEFLVPADFVFIPYNGPSRIQGVSNTSNGLAVGCSLEEAVFHALTELIERDTCSFSRVFATEQIVDLSNFRLCRSLLQKISAARLRLYVTENPNDFALPTFTAYLFDEYCDQGVSVARGQGSHPDDEIAVLRAITEAVQSRLTNIHGGRDDIVNRFRYYSEQEAGIEHMEYNALEKRLHDLPIAGKRTASASGKNLETSLREIWEMLKKEGMHQVLYCDLTRHITTHKVVRLIVPGLEYFSTKRPVVGKRMLVKWYKKNPG